MTSPRGAMLVGEFEDVVLLSEVHRIDRDLSGVSEAEAARYSEEADRFLRVTSGLADCKWTEEDHRWLSRRNRQQLLRTAEGRAQVAECDKGLLLMDGVKKNARGEDGAEQLNQEELKRLAEKAKCPILSIRSYHKKPQAEEDLQCDLLEADEFQGLSSGLNLCKGARVLLFRNCGELTGAGLMNGAIGTVLGFVWPSGGDPHATSGDKQAPLCVLVEFDDIDLGWERERWGLTENLGS